MFRPSAKKIDKYTIVKELGRGNFGTTYQAELNGKFYTIKVYNQATPSSRSLQSIKNDFKHESQLLTEIRPYCQEHLPCFTEMIENNSAREYYLVFEYVEGISLESNNIDKPTSEAFTWSFLKQILTTTKLLHDNYVVHRDIKPANVIFNPATGKFILIDLGLSCINTCVAIAGTPNYLSPTIKQKIANISKGTRQRAFMDENDPTYHITLAEYQGSDIYAIGATAFYLATGVIFNSYLEAKGGYENAINSMVKDMACSIALRVYIKSLLTSENLTLALDILPDAIPDVLPADSGSFVLVEQPLLNGSFEVL